MASPTFGDMKMTDRKSMEPAKGGSSGDGRAPGGTRHYPKGSSNPGNSQSAPFNPQKVAATDKYVGGI